MKKIVSLLLALVLTLSLCVNAIAEPAGGSNEPAQERQRLDDGVPAEARGVAHRAEVLDEASADSA